MTRMRPALALGATALAATMIGGAGEAYAWAPGSVRLTATCKGQAGRIELTVTNTDAHDGSFVISNDKTPDQIKGSVKGKGAATFTVPYTGPGTTWTVRFDLGGEDVHASATTGNEPTCLPAKPSPSPSPTPTPTAVAPSPTPAVPTVPTPSAAGRQLATTGGGDDTGMITGAAATLLLVGGVILHRTRRRSRET